MEQITKGRQQKQTYIIENIDPNLYEDFHQFCNSYAGQIDIDNWPLVYVHQLVAKFKEDQKKKMQIEDHHQKSFAVYQTTSGENQIIGSSNLQMNQVLQTLEQPKKTFNTTTRNPTVSPSSQDTKINHIQRALSPNAFSKKQVAGNAPTASTPTNNKLPQNQYKTNKFSAVQLLDSAFQQAKDTDKSKIEDNVEKMNKSFFDSVNFWEVPKIDELPKNTKVEQKTEVPKLPSPSTKEFKSIKLNLNVNQLTNNKNSGSDKKKQQVAFQTKNRTSEIQAVNYGGDQGNIQTFFNTGNVIKNNNIEPDSRSQFDTFTQIAEQQIKKKRTNTVAVTSPKTNINDNQKQLSSTIKLKQVKQFKPSSSTLTKLSKASSIKQPYKGSRIFNQDFVDQVFCVKSSIRPNLAHQNLAIQIKNYEIVQRSIFSSNYLMYNMKVIPSGTICKRNYEDFQKLKTTLQKFYPGIQMPYLDKQGWRADTSQDFAKKQIQMLHFFMADILRNPQLRNSRITQQFLSVTDHKKMKRKFQQYGRMTNLKSIEELCLLQGKVQVTLTQKERIYNECMQKLIIKTGNNIEKYHKNCQTLTQYYSQAMSTMLTIDDILKQIQKDLEDFNKCVTTKQIQNLDQSIKMIRNGYTQNYFRMKFQKNIIEQSVLPFLKYEKQNIHVSKDIIDTSNILIAKYLKRMESERNQSMDSSYLSSNYKQYKQGILEESKNIIVLKYQAGYLQAQASSELQRIFNALGIKIEDLWKNIGGKYLQQLSKSVSLWSQTV